MGGSLVGDANLRCSGLCCYAMDALRGVYDVQDRSPQVIREL